MGHVFQAECWEKYPIGCSFWLLSPRGNWKIHQKRLLKGKEALIGILFMKIGEKEGERSQVSCEEENEGK